MLRLLRNKYIKQISSFALIVGFSLFLPKQLTGAVKGPYWTEKDPAAKKAMQSRIDLLNETIVDLAQSLSPAVVSVLTTSEIRVPQMDQMFDFFFGQQMFPRQ